MAREGRSVVWIAAAEDTHHYREMRCIQSSHTLGTDSEALSLQHPLDEKLQ